MSQWFHLLTYHETYQSNFVDNAIYSRDINLLKAAADKEWIHGPTEWEQDEDGDLKRKAGNTRQGFTTQIIAPAPEGRILE